MEKSRRAATECPFVRDTKTPIVEYGVFIDGPFERSEINTDSPLCSISSATRASR